MPQRSGDRMAEREWKRPINFKVTSSVADCMWLIIEAD